MGQCEKTLGAPDTQTRLDLLDTQIDMVTEVSALVKEKGRRIGYAVIFLALAAALIVLGSEAE